MADPERTNPDPSDEKGLGKFFGGLREIKHIGRRGKKPPIQPPPESVSIEHSTEILLPTEEIITTEPLPLISPERKHKKPRSTFEHLKPIGQKSEDAETERLRRIIKTVQEIDVNNEELLHEYATLYLRLLKDEHNRPHFTGIPRTIEEFELELKKPSIHPLLGINELGEAVGFARISDAAENQSDHFLEGLVVHNRLQSKRKSQGPRTGRQFLDKIVEWAFTTNAYDPATQERTRRRASLHTAIVLKVPGAERVDDLFDHYGFAPVMRIQDHATVYLNGKYVVKPVQRFFINRSYWFARKYMQEHPGFSGK